MNNKHLILLPFNTPHKDFQGKVFHPAALPYSGTKRNGEEYDESKDYTSYSSVKVASTLSYAVAATIPPRSTIKGAMISELIGSFVNPENILAEVELIETDATDIASQVRAALDCFPNMDKVVVIWPYQVFNEKGPFSFAGGDMSCGYTHPLTLDNKENAPEGIVFSVEDEGDKDQTSCKIRNVMKVSEVDTLIKGSFTRTVSIVEIARSEFDVFWEHNAARTDIYEFLKDTLPGRTAGLVNPDGNGFI